MEAKIQPVSVEDELKTDGEAKVLLGFLILFGISQITKSVGTDGEFDGLAFAENYEKKYIYIFFLEMV